MKYRKAYTLVELLVSIFAIGITLLFVVVLCLVAYALFLYVT